MARNPVIPGLAPKPDIFSNTAIIKVGSDFAIIDKEDLHKVWGRNWRKLDKHNNVCAGAYPTRLLLHRVICNLPNSRNPVVDHKNRNPLDNRKINLRVCTQLDNTHNQGAKMTRGKTSKFKGVNWYPNNNKWQARITNNKKRISLGYFEKETQAAHVYDIAALKYHGDFAYTNFPKDEYVS